MMDANHPFIAVRGGLRDAVERMFGPASVQAGHLIRMGQEYRVDTNLDPDPFP
jgi:hypothetical protein